MDTRLGILLTSYNCNVFNQHELKERGVQISYIIRVQTDARASLYTKGLEALDH